MTAENCESSEQQFEEEEEEDDAEEEEKERRIQARYDIMLKYLIETKTKEELAQVLQEMSERCPDLAERLLQLKEELPESRSIKDKIRSLILYVAVV